MLKIQFVTIFVFKCNKFAQFKLNVISLFVIINFNILVEMILVFGKS